MYISDDDVGAARVVDLAERTQALVVAMVVVVGPGLHGLLGLPWVDLGAADLGLGRRRWN